MEIANVSVFLAFAAGVVSILSPCVLPLIPIYLAYLTGATAGDLTANVRSAAVLHSIAFTAGFGVVLIILGISVGLLGYALRDNLDLISKIAGVLVVLMGLHVARVFRIPLLERQYTLEVASGNPVSYLRSFGIGAAYSVGWSPCIGPTLGAVLGLAATTSTVAQGGLLLAVYALGFSVPFIAAAFAIGSARGVLVMLNPHLAKIELASGVVLVAVGVLLFRGALIELNQYFSRFSPSISF